MPSDTGVANFETKLVKFGGDIDPDALRGSHVLYALRARRLSVRSVGQRSWVLLKEGELSVMAMWPQDQRQFRDL